MDFISAFYEASAKVEVLQLVKSKFVNSMKGLCAQ